MLHKVAFSPLERKQPQPVFAGGGTLHKTSLSTEQNEKHYALESAFLADRGCLCKQHVGKGAMAPNAA